MNNWISVKKALPYCGIDPRQPKGMFPLVLATDGKRIEKVYYQVSYKTWFIGTFGDNNGNLQHSDNYIYDSYLENVTHWMLLPEPPKIELPDITEEEK